MSTDPLVHWARLLVCLLAFIWLPARLSSQDTTVSDPCDPRLVRPPGDPLAYGNRGDRCEGLYIREVAGSGGVSVAAFTETFEPLEIKAGARLTLAWSAPEKLPVRLRAVSLQRRLYYRMDTTRPAGADRFEWPADLLAKLNLKSPELGIVGWVQYRVGKRSDDVYVPVRLGKADGIRPKGRYVVLVTAGADLAEVYLTLATVTTEGRDETFLKRDEPLKHGFYPAERPITVRLPELPRAGLYRLQVGALLSNGGSSTRILFFYHAGG